MSSTQIAAIRTVAPLVWAGLVTWLLERGVDLTAEVADLTNLPESIVEVAAPLLIGVLMWLIALQTSWDTLQRILMFVGVDGYQYEQGDEIVTATSRIARSDIVVADPGVAGDAEFTDAAISAILRRHVSQPTLLAAAQRLTDQATDLPADDGRDAS